MMQIRIIKVNNGFEVKGEDLEVVVAVKDEDSDSSWKEALTEVFERIADHFGFGYDGFGKENLKVTWGRLGDEMEEDKS